MTTRDFTLEEEMLRERLRDLALPTDATAHWEDVCRRAATPRRARRRKPSRPVLLLAAAILVLAGAAAAIADPALPNLLWQGDATPGWHDGEIQALTNMAIFQTPRNPSDALPDDVASDFRELTANRPDITPGLLPGTGLLAQSRLLLSDIGPRHSSVYVVPTSKGQICEFMAPGGGGCFSGFARPSHPVGLIQYGAVLIGLVPDQITRIGAVQTDGSVIPLAIHNNAFALAAPQLDATRSLTLTYDDGSTSRLDVPQQPAHI